MPAEVHADNGQAQASRAVQVSLAACVKAPAAFVLVRIPGTATFRAAMLDTIHDHPADVAQRGEDGFGELSIEQ